MDNRICPSARWGTQSVKPRVPSRRKNTSWRARRSARLSSPFSPPSMSEATDMRCKTRFLASRSRASSRSRRRIPRRCWSPHLQGEGLATHRGYYKRRSGRSQHRSAGDASGAYLLHSVPGPSGPRRFWVVSVGPQIVQVKGNMLEASTRSAWYTMPRHCRVLSVVHLDGESVQSVETGRLRELSSIETTPQGAVERPGGRLGLRYVPLLYVGQHGSWRCGGVLAGAAAVQITWKGKMAGEARQVLARRKVLAPGRRHFRRCEAPTEREAIKTKKISRIWPRVTLNFQKRTKSCSLLPSNLKRQGVCTAL